MEEITNDFGFAGRALLDHSKLNQRELSLRNFWMGYSCKELVSLLLEDVGYEVYPYGFETFLPSLKKKLYDRKQSSTARRIRFTPDLLVRDPDKVGWLRFVEVKGRNEKITDEEALNNRSLYSEQEAQLFLENFGGEPLDIQIPEVADYRKLWPESVLVLVVPSGKIIYARPVSDLPDSIVINLVRDFFPLETEFPRLQGSRIRRILVRYFVEGLFLTS